MKYYKFTKDFSHYKEGQVLAVEKENKLLKELIEDKTVEKTTKPVAKKKDK